jgi:outer membrane lipoprotein carrier protein
MTKTFFILWLAFAPLLSFAQPEPDTDLNDLLAALAPIERLQGLFSQRQYGQDGLLLAESSGSFKLLRPGYFAWEILSPDQQLIIADPDFIWHYDRDLETVTRRPVTSESAMAPLQILGGDESALREKFQIDRAEDGAFVLTPISENAGFKQLTLHLGDAQITGMDVLDNLGQQVMIEFSNLDGESALTDSDFAFTPPEGADLFYYDE